MPAWMILVAGPYRSGTGDDPARMDANRAAMNEAALALFRRGHLAVTGEALALPLMEHAGSGKVGDATWDAIFHPLARRLVARCDAVLRIGGASAGADEMVALAAARGLRVFRSIDAVPDADADADADTDADADAHAPAPQRGAGVIRPPAAPGSPFGARDSEHVRIVQTTLLSDHWYVLEATTFDLRRRDGTWQRQRRETYDRGDGATILLVDPTRGTVVLTRQFRFPAYVNGLDDGMLIETIGGLLDRDDPASCIRRETEEETGYRIAQVREIGDIYMSPGSVTERVHFFVGEYRQVDRVGAGGGEVHEGEDIEVLEPTLDEALAMVADGRIRDGKTILLLQYAALNGLLDPKATR